MPESITANRDIELDLSDITGADRMRYGERPPGLHELDWLPLTQRVSLRLTAGDGSKVIDVELANDDGGMSRREVSIRLAVEPPSGTFVINGGSRYTDSRQVEIDTRGVTGGDFMRFASARSDLENVDWLDFAPRTEFTIGSEEGSHTVHGQFEDELGRSFETSATITLMTSAPGGAFCIDGGATHTNHPERRVLLDFSRVRGASELRVANEDEDLEAKDFVDMVSVMEWTLSPGEGRKEVRAEFRSPTGVTDVSAASIIYDVTPPAEPMISSPGRTGDRSPMWVWSSEGATRYGVSFRSGTWLETTETSFVPDEPLSVCNRAYELMVAAGDEAGNWSEPAASTIFVYCEVAGSVALHDPDGGDLYIALLSEQEYTGAQPAPEEERLAVVSPDSGRFSFSDIADGEWMLLGFQDNDGNGELTLGLFGAPIEPWGTYQGESWAGLISFSEGHFAIDGDGRGDIVLRLSGFHW